MLEHTNLIFDIICGIIAVGAVILAWRKKLLNTGFETFKETYRVEMDAFKAIIQAKVVDIIGSSNKHMDENRKNYERMVQVQGEILEQVKAQSSTCRIIQARREGLTKADEMRLTKIESELRSIKKNVDHITGVINHKKKES